MNEIFYVFRDAQYFVTHFRYDVGVKIDVV